MSSPSLSELLVGQEFTLPNGDGQPDAKITAMPITGPFLLDYRAHAAAGYTTYAIFRTFVTNFENVPLNGHPPGLLVSKPTIKPDDVGKYIDYLAFDFVQAFVNKMVDAAVFTEEETKN